MQEEEYLRDLFELFLSFLLTEPTCKEYDITDKILSDSFIERWYYFESRKQNEDCSLSAKAAIHWFRDYDENFRKKLVQFYERYLNGRSSGGSS